MQAFPANDSGWTCAGVANHDGVAFDDAVQALLDFDATHGR